jgi:diguanylate cyclase (GGDEF)-like protein/PAS domain S-box-containing protein
VSASPPSAEGTFADPKARALDTFLESSQYGLLLLDEELTVVWVSNAGAAALRYDAAELIGRQGHEFLDPSQHLGVVEAISEVLRIDGEVELGWQLGVRVRLVCGDGRSRDFEFGGWAVGGDGPPEMMLVFVDVSERSRLEDVLTAITEHDLEGALHHFLNLASSQLRAAAGIALHPSLGGTSYATPGARPSLFDELTASELRPWVRSIEAPGGTVFGWLVVDREEMSPWGIETMDRLTSLLGLVLAHQATLTNLVDAAATDPLTGLANRRVLDVALLGAETAPEQGWAVLFCDLDRFKSVNDAWGHDAGDVVLCAVADRLRKVVRSADVIARLGGDEFVILMHADRAQAELLVERVRESVSHPIADGDQRFELGISIGVATAATAEGVRRLLVDADEAMRRDKATHHGGAGAAR